MVTFVFIFIYSTHEERPSSHSLRFVKLTFLRCLVAGTCPSSLSVSQINLSFRLPFSHFTLFTLGYRPSYTGLVCFPSINIPVSGKERQVVTRKMRRGFLPQDSLWKSFSLLISIQLWIFTVNDNLTSHSPFPLSLVFTSSWVSFYQMSPETCLH